MGPLVEFATVAKSVGCPRDQVHNFMKAGLVLQPKQLEMSSWARRCDLPDGPNCLGVGGSRGGAKTHWMFSQICADDCQRFPGLKGLMLRKTQKAMREQVMDLKSKICHQLEHNYRAQVGTIEFPNGSSIIIGHFKDEKEIENYIGQEYDFIAIEELTTLTFEKWKNLMSCMRSSKTGWRPRMYASWNWGGVGHAWVKKIFYEPYESKKEVETKFIKATIYDNPLLMKNDPNYVKFLESLTGWKRKSWLEGDPNFQAGQFFVNWSEEHVVYPNPKVGINPTMVKWFASFDHGFSHPCCCHLHGEDKEGNIYTVDEYHVTETVPFENAENIKAMLRTHHVDLWQLDYFVAGNDCFNRNAEGKTIESMYAEYGITLTPAKVDRINRWEIMGDKLGNPEKGVAPKWFIHRRCKHLISQIPMAQSHETRIGDIGKQNADENGEGGDDALECASFGLSSHDSGRIKFAMPAQVSKGAHRWLAQTHGLTLLGG